MASSFKGLAVASAFALPQGLTSRCSLYVYRQSYLTAPKVAQPRQHASPRRLFSQQPPNRPRFSSRLRAALKNSKIQWYQIPVGLGIGFLGLVQFYRVTSRERERERERQDEQEERDCIAEKRPKRRPRIRPDGPWYGATAPPHHIVILLLILKAKASPGYVYSAIEGLVEAVGQV